MTDAPSPEAQHTSNLTHRRANPDYWQSRYEKGETGWDIGYPSTPIKEYVDQLTDQELRILIPGAGNAHEAEYLWRKGFRNLVVLDIAQAPLDNLRQRVPELPPANTMLGDFFTHQGEYDLILEQTFFCSFPPTEDNRKQYAKRVHELLAPGGKLVGVLFNFPRDPQNGPPFGGDREEYLRYFSPMFKIKVLDTANNSIKPRTGKELFIILEKN